MPQPHNLFSLGFLFAFTLFLVGPSHGQNYYVNGSTARPVPGTGHDYIQMLSETINPADGSLSIRINVPGPKGRGVTPAFSFTYNSNGIYYPFAIESEGTTVLPNKFSGKERDSESNLDNFEARPVARASGFDVSGALCSVSKRGADLSPEPASRPRAMTAPTPCAHTTDAYA